MVSRRSHWRRRPTCSRARSSAAASSRPGCRSDGRVAAAWPAYRGRALPGGARGPRHCARLPCLRCASSGRRGPMPRGPSWPTRWSVCPSFDAAGRCVPAGEGGSQRRRSCFTASARRGVRTDARTGSTPRQRCGRACRKAVRSKPSGPGSGDRTRRRPTVDREVGPGVPLGRRPEPSRRRLGSRRGPQDPLVADGWLFHVDQLPGLRAPTGCRTRRGEGGSTSPMAVHGSVQPPGP